MYKLKEKLLDELYEYEDKAKKNPDARISDSEVQKIHILTDTVKNICKIEMLEDGGGYSERIDSDSKGGYSRRGGEWEARGGYGDTYMRDGGMSSYNNGGHSYDGGNSYGRRKRDSMGRYSRADGKEQMTDHLREMMENAQGEEREAIRECINKLEKM